MEEKDPLLCIGGPYHGHWMDGNKFRGNLTLPIPTPPLEKPALKTADEAPLAEPSKMSVVYRREKFTHHTSGRTVRCLVAEGLTDDQAIELLDRGPEQKAPSSC